MLSTAKSANVGFSQVVQLFAPLANLAQKILFINSEKKLGVNNVRKNIRVY